MIRKMMNENKKTSIDHGLVSIIMPCYNAALFLKEAIESVIAQTYSNWELILVDDCSQDNSWEIATQFSDLRIKVMRNATNSGATVSRNKAIEAASGRWIAFLDSDDIWMEDKLEKHLTYMTDNDIAFSFTHYSVMNDQNKQITVYTPKKSVYDYRMIVKHSTIGCSTVIYDSAKLGKVYMPQTAVKREDFACWLQILKSGVDAYCYHKCLTKYRVHGNSVSSNKLKMVSYQWNVYRKVENLSWIRSAYYMIHWAVRGVLKYR